MKKKNTNRQLVIALNVILLMLSGIFVNSAFAQQAEKKAVTQPPKKEEKAKAEPEAITEKKVESWQKEVTGWRVKDYRPYIKAMKDLERLNKEFSENLLRVAIDEYSTGLDILGDMEREIKRLVKYYNNKKNFNEQWFWQQIDRKNREKRHIGIVRKEAKVKSVTFFVKAINRLDEIESREVRDRGEFENFQIRLYQVYVSTQYDVHSFMPCIPILERYINLNYKTKNDVWAYKYLSSCYAFMEAMFKKYRHSTQEQIFHYKHRKNKHMLFAAELKYGVNSVEYKHLQEIVEGDEKKTQMLNDFQ